MCIFDWHVALSERSVQNALSEAKRREKFLESREKAFEALLPTMVESIKKDIRAGNVKTVPEMMRLLGLDGG